MVPGIVCVLPTRLLDTTAFRLALIYLGLFGASALALLGYLYVATAGFMDRQTTETIQAEIAGLAEQYRTQGLPRLLPYDTSYIPTGATAVTRNADTDTYPTAGNVGTTGTVYLEFTPTHAQFWGNVSRGCLVDVNNFTQMLVTNTSIILRKRVAGVNYDAMELLTVVSGVTYKIAVRFGTSGQQIAVNGVLGTATADSTLGRPLSCHLAVIDPQYGDRNMITVRGEDAGHADLRPRALNALSFSRALDLNLDLDVDAGRKVLHNRIR